MRYFIDTEFEDTGREIDLISIAIVSQDGRKFIRVNKDYDLSLADEWLQVNVIPFLPKDKSLWVHYQQISRDIVDFIGSDPNPQFWGYNSDYDWVVFCQLFGGMMKLPPRWPHSCLDIKQVLWHLRITDIKRLVPNMHQHDALGDAEWNKNVLDYIMDVGSRIQAEPDELQDAPMYPRSDYQR